MPTNFFAILGDLEDRSARRIQVTKAIQDTLAAEFEQQAKDFVTHSVRIENHDGKREKAEEESERVSFFPIYSLSDNKQVFEIKDFAMDAFILSAAKNPDSLHHLKLDDKTIPQIKAFCAVTGSKTKPTIYFQAFDRRRILGKNRFTFLQSGNSFSRLDQAGFTLADGLQAIYENGTLLFRSFTVVSRFLSLIELFNEASNEKIEEVLGHQLLSVSNPDEVIQFSDTHMRKQFAAISELGVLEKASPKGIAAAAAEFDISLSVKTHNGKSRVDFPTEKRQQKELLSLLTEGYYKGPLTGNKYQSNSHRPLKPKSAKTAPASKAKAKGRKPR